MKKIKNKWQVWVNALLTTIMGWLAMSCDLAPMYGPPVNLYAPPAPDPESYLMEEGKQLHVIPSRSIPQGITAMLSFNPEGEENENIMEICCCRKHKENTN